jgi:cysteinyl-tRNA synthetase
MKTKTILFTCAAALALGLAGCSKNEPITPTANDANKAPEATNAVAEATNAVAEATNAVAEATNAVAEATNAVAEATNAVDTSNVQALIDKAKSLVAETNFTEASSVLQQLAGQSLTDEQQKLVDSLKDQIQKALAAKAAGGAAGAAGDLLKQ